MSDSVWNDPRITAYALGDLPDDQRNQFEREIESNPELAAAVEEARSVTGQLEELYAAEPTASLDRERRETISSGESQVASVQDGSRSWRIPVLVLATAAALLLLVGIGPWLKQQQLELAATHIGENSTDESVAFEGMTREGELDLVIEEQIVDPASQEPSESFRELAVTPLSGVALQAVTAADSSAESEPSKSVAATSRLSELESLDAGAIVNKRSESFELKLSKDTRMETVLERDRIAARGSKRDLAIVAPAIKEAEAMPGISRAKRTADAKSESGQAGGRKMSAGLAKRPDVAKRSAVVPGRITLGADVSRQIAPKQASKGFGRGRIGEAAFALDVDYALPIDEGRGPGIAGDRFEPITDNAFKRVSEHPLSTFSVDVDTASYSKTRDFLMRANQLPRPDAVRIEEMLNYFDYDYAPPSADDKHPFAARATVTSCPWNSEHRLARIAIKGKTMDSSERPQCNLVFLIDTSGSMKAPNKLPLVIAGMKMLVEQLDPKDRVAITVYAGSAGLVLDSTRARKSKKINKALEVLSAGGSTNGGAGIALAYQTARENFISEGVNRVILCTDGDFNVGTTGTDELVRMVEREAKENIFLTVLGFGMGNHNDAMLEKISGRGNGNYAFIDNENEARKVLVDQTSGTLVTIAKDVKLQIEFNPTHVSSYRLIGYENRVLAKEDFNDDKKDAGEIGAGHSVTALYEIVPPGFEADVSQLGVDALKYQSEPKSTDAADSEEMMTLKLRYKQPDGDTSTLVEFPVIDDGATFDKADDDVRFAAAVAGFGMQLRHSDYRGRWTIREVLKVAQGAQGEDEYGLRAEFVELVRKASELLGETIE